jgi:hypothetical protein
MNTITDDLNGLPPLPKYTIHGPTGTGSYFSGHTDAALIAYGRAVLALAELKQAAALADLRRWRSTHAPRIEALQGLLGTAQREAAEGTEARSTMSSEREANTILTAEVELLRARIAELQAELERERMRLAACGVVAMADTPASAAKERDMHPDYLSASCDDVARRVDECIAMRARIAELEGQIDRQAESIRFHTRRADSMHAALKAAQPAQVPWSAADVEELRHVANEWADFATNGLQWVRNIVDEISKPADALANLTSSMEHCRAVNDGSQAMRRAIFAPKPAQVAVPTQAESLMRQYMRETMQAESESMAKVFAVPAPKQEGGFLSQIDKARASVESWPDALKGGVCDVQEGGE